MDIFCSLLHIFFLCTTDGYISVIININLYTGLFDDCIDRLSTLSYNISDLLRIDLHLDDLRSKLSNFCPRLCDCFAHHFIHDISSCFLRRCDCFFNDRSCQSVDLDIHLDRSNTLMSTCNLKVHIAKEIFQSLNICQNQIIIIRLACYESCRNTRYSRLDRHTC